MKKTDIVGKTITHMFRSSFETYQPSEKSGLGEMQFCRIFIETDNEQLLEFGTSKRSYPLETVDSSGPSVDLVELQFGADGSEWVDMVVEEVYVCPIDQSIYIRLSDGRYIWVEDDVEGTVLRMEGEEWLESEQIPLTPYWGTECNEMES